MSPERIYRACISCTIARERRSAILGLGPSAAVVAHALRAVLVSSEVKHMAHTNSDPPPSYSPHQTPLHQNASLHLHVPTDHKLKLANIDY